MDVQRIIAELDAEISHLQGIRASLSGLPGNNAGSAPGAASKGRRGRPKGSKNVPKVTSQGAAAPAKAGKRTGKRKLSPEGRKAIADAMKKRWAERRKETAAK